MNNVEKLWETLRENVWGICGKIKALLTDFYDYFVVLWRNLVFAQVLPKFYKLFYTGKLRYYSLLEGGFYTFST